MAEQSQPSGGGYDIGASLSGSASSGASLSGATDQGGSYNFGTAYGPGSLLLTDQRGSIGASANASSLLPLIAVGAVVLFALMFFLNSFRR